MATGYLGQSGINTYFKNGPISLGVTLPANTYPNGSLTLDNMGMGQAVWYNPHIDAHSFTVFLCDSAGNNAVELFTVSIPGGGQSYTPASATVSGAQGLAGKALYIKATGDTMSLNRMYIRNRTAVTIATASLALSITCSAGTGGSLTANKATAAPGETVTLTPTPATGYQLSGYSSSPTVTISNNKFTMPNSAVSITASFSKINYAITKKVSPAGAGTVTAPATATYGSSVSISQTPAAGYVFDHWTTSPALTISGGAFTMPAQAVTVTAVYKKLSTATISGTLTGGTTATMTITAADPAFSHKWQLSFGTGMETAVTDAAAGVTSVSISIPDSWSEQIPNAATKTGGTLVLQTYDGQTLLGSYTVTDLTYAVPAGAVPVMGTVTLSVARTIGGTTYANIGDIYTQLHSGVRVQADAEGSLGATVVSMAVAISGYSGSDYNTTVSDDEIDFTSGLLQVAGAAVITVTATDSRGRVTTQAETITVTGYNAPTGALAIRRVDLQGDDDDTGQYAAYILAKTWSAIGTNSLTVTMTSQGSSEALSADSGDILPGTRQTFSTQQEYTVTVTLADAFETVTVQAKLRSAKFIIYVNADGDKLSFMKAANKSIPTGKNGTIEFSGDAQIYIGDDTLEDYIRDIVQNM